MEPSRYNILIMLAVVVGLIATQGCGGSKSSSSSSSSSSGTTGGVTISNEVNSPADMGVGDIMMAQFSSSSSAEFNFSGVSASSKYYFAVGNLDSGYGSHTIRLTSALSAIDSKTAAEIVYEEEGESAEWDNWTVNDAFSQRLRNVGAVLAQDPEFEIAAPADEVNVNFKASLLKAVGDTEEFRVLSSLTNLTSYATVTARVKCLKDNFVLYLDTEVETTNPSDLILYHQSFPNSFGWDRIVFTSFEVSL